MASADHGDGCTRRPDYAASVSGRQMAISMPITSLSINMGGEPTRMGGDVNFHVTCLEDS
jgi:hypothetical protein